VGGTAMSGTDYGALGTTVSFAAGVSVVDKLVVPVSDTSVEGDETVTVTLAAGTGYTVGSPATATVTIVDGASAGPEEPGGPAGDPRGAAAGAAAAMAAPAVATGATGATLEAAAGASASPALTELGLIRAPTLEVLDGYAVLSYLRIKPNPGFEYEVERSGDLQEWQSAAGRVAERVTDVDPTTEFVEVRYLEPITPEAMHFLRLKIRAQ
jgi:hypothetical protein